MESVALILLLALTYFFRLWRLWCDERQQFCSVLTEFDLHHMCRVAMASCIPCGGMKHVVRADRRLGILPRSVAVLELQAERKHISII